jgi:hypothetical protein
MVAAFFTHYGVVSNRSAIGGKYSSGPSAEETGEMAQIRPLQLRRPYGYRSFGLLPLRPTYLRHERIPPGLLSARPINLGPAVCMKRGRHGGRSQRGRVSFWTRVRGERTTTASLRNLISLPRCAKRRPVLQKNRTASPARYSQQLH